MNVDRRACLFTGFAALCTSAALPSRVEAMSRRSHRIRHGSAPPGVSAALFTAAVSAFERHGGQLRRDRIAMIDFALPSSQARFHLVDLAGGPVRSLFVSHGSGSDPEHSGWLQRFSNELGSYATSEGAFVTGDHYEGEHGRSQRLIGLDPTNGNALARAIVVHGAWYAEESMIARQGKLGRSQGCFAVGDSALNGLFDWLGEGRLIFAAKPPEIPEAKLPG